MEVCVMEPNVCSFPSTRSWGVLGCLFVARNRCWCRRVQDLMLISWNMILPGRQIGCMHGTAGRQIGCMHGTAGPHHAFTVLHVPACTLT
eukprot:1158765-Pelagomonas_calceolata.AAC.5